MSWQVLRWAMPNVNYSHSDKNKCTEAGCELVFKTLAMIHAEKREKHACEYCPKTFLCPKAYRGHIQSHTKSTPDLPCDQCDMMFYSKILLSAHVSSKHTEKDPIICELCSKPFKNKTALLVFTLTFTIVKLIFSLSGWSVIFAIRHSQPKWDWKIIYISTTEKS